MNICRSVCGSRRILAPPGGGGQVEVPGDIVWDRVRVTTGFLEVPIFFWNSGVS